MNCGADGTQTTQPYTWVNVSGHYTAGDTIKLCGTINGPNTVNGVVFSLPAAGTSSNPITMFWESNASISEPACATFDSGGCIAVNGNGYWIFNGNGTTNSIVNTANGTSGSYAYSVQTQGFVANPCNGCVFKNLDIENLYVMTTSGDNAPSGFSHDTSGIYISGSGYTITNSTFNNLNHGITSAFGNGDNGNVFSFLTFNNMNQGISMGNNNSNTMSNIQMHDIHLGKMATWDNKNDDYHHDGIFFFQDSAKASAIQNVYIWNVLADGDIGANCTAWIYYNSGLNGIYVFNSKFFNPAARGCRMIEGGYNGDQNYYLYNNYVDCGGTGDGATGMAFSNGGSGSVTGFSAENNTFHNCGIYMDIGPGVLVGSGAVEHNVYESACTSNRCFQWNGNGTTFSSWQTNCACDSHSLTPTNVGANGSGVPQAGSAMIHDNSAHFQNLASSCSGPLAPLCVDYSGNPRASSGSNNWDAGAYVYASSGAPSPPTGLQALVH